MNKILETAKRMAEHNYSLEDIVEFVRTETLKEAAEIARSFDADNEDVNYEEDNEAAGRRHASEDIATAIENQTLPFNKDEEIPQMKGTWDALDKLTIKNNQV